MLLPVYEILPELQLLLKDRTIVLLQAPPGAGKSTVLPNELLHENWLQGKKILVLEPRRLAAKSVAQRLAENLNENPGETVGYRIRFESKIGPQTRIEVVTEGILIRMLQHDNALEEYGAILFDEFHERSLNADLSLALCREAQQVLRPDLRLLIMSATLGCESLASELGDVPVVKSEGRLFPIDYYYLEEDRSVSIAQNTATHLRKILSETTGDILAFLPGSGDILQVMSLFESSPVPCSVFPLYGDLPFQQQQDALRADPTGRRKIILSTSIAETSLTIEGVSVVFDSGYTRTPKFDPRSGFTRLETVRISQDTATQRAGRAGRTSKGTAYRMWSKHLHAQLAEHRKPEIADADLAPLVLELAQWGEEDIFRLSWVTPPPTANVEQARKTLVQLGALDMNGKITASGKEMAELPTHPRIAHLLHFGKQNNLSTTACDIAALLEERDPLRNNESADLTLRLEALEKWRKKEHTSADRKLLERIEQLSLQWRKLTGAKTSIATTDHYSAGSLIAAAFPERIARRADNQGRFRLGNGRMARLPKNDVLSDEAWIAVAALDAGTTEGKIFLAAAFDESKLLPLATQQEVVFWNTREGNLVARKEWRVGDLLVKEVPIHNITSEQRTKAICDFLQTEGIENLNWSESAEQLLFRLSSLRIWNPQFELPEWNQTILQNSVQDWLGPYVSQVKSLQDLEKIQIDEVLFNHLSWEQQQIIHEYAPESIEVPSGSSIRLQYFEDGRSPVLSVRLQECFGLSETPTVNKGKINVLMHLLSPGYKPVQITQDLKSFWNNLYHEVRKELKIRYPKHSWPEDPWTAVAVRGAVKKKK